ncbi:DUF6636 domain-containing protein [Mycolicibacterium moriokaense]|uniref:Uncharacterized protein n=1 Tax=Mycolicibacterium moriokaense TaxID=39691 RepID=A0AAD1M6N2_9MYCO|nr:DUF6636 domain-containing protein [Mycolicibacterium moriokaense]BBX03017.1 hypothetical protein MMOR_39530 [Mycolicibacterium moriokaense]
MAQLDRRLLAAVAGVAGVLILAACANSPDPQPMSASSTVALTVASATGSAPTTDSPQPLDQEVSGYTGFISPTGNVSCAIAVNLARCDIIDRDWSPPPRPADCEFDYGQGISIAPGEPATFVCAGDTTFGAEEVLPYGKAITAGALRCESAESRITCRDVQTGNGFTISRQAYQIF